jgi:hypothetical protein
MTNSVQDEYGNKLAVVNSTIYLILKDDKKKRQIGRLNLAARTLTMKRDRNKHLHYKSNSYGFNYQIIKQGTKFNKILIADNEHNYLVPKEEMLEMGKFMYFKQQGFERQIFVKLEDLSNYIIGKVI